LAKPALCRRARFPEPAGGVSGQRFLELTAICLVRGVAGAFASLFLELEREDAADAPAEPEVTRKRGDVRHKVDTNPRPTSTTSEVKTGRIEP
jgi:hypothetical protein